MFVFLGIRDFLDFARGDLDFARSISVYILIRVNLSIRRRVHPLAFFEKKQYIDLRRNILVTSIMDEINPEPHVTLQIIHKPPPLHARSSSQNAEDSYILNLNNPLLCPRCCQTFLLGESEEDDDDDESTSPDSEDKDDSVSHIFREDPEEIEERMLEEIDAAVTNNSLCLSRPTIEKELATEIATMLFEEWQEEDLCEEWDLEEILEWTQNMVEFYFKCGASVPPRQGGEAAPLTPLRTASLTRKMQVLNSIQSPTQKTQEWYDKRYGLMTASNLWKALGTESQRNQLIVEKCQPFEQFKRDCARQMSGSLSGDNPMSWGQKYEPVTALLYQRLNHTTLGEYGCIVHPEYPFLGASPDGINVDQASPLYGRMVEIKNIVNRDIDGIPSTAYWIQTQIQMEVCDLDECDFVETRFKEYATKMDFFESENPCRGIILSFVPRVTIEQTMYSSVKHDSSPIHEYWFLDSTKSVAESGRELEQWSQSKKDAHSANYVLSNCSFWGLDQYSCVLIKRNRVWFEAAIPKITAIWRIIERERITGCEHRAPKKREPTEQSAVATSVVITKINNSEIESMSDT